MRKDLHKLLLCVATIGALCLTTAFCHAADSIEVVRAKADQGEASAQLDLGLSYFKGTGVVKDEVEAVKWYRKAADRGDALAQYTLGFMYANGTGVAKDETEAYKWTLLAGAQGNEGARSNTPKIELRLTPQQRADGQRLAREFKPSNQSSSKGSPR